MNYGNLVILIVRPLVLIRDAMIRHFAHFVILVACLTELGCIPQSTTGNARKTNLPNDQYEFFASLYRKRIEDDAELLGPVTLNKKYSLQISAQALFKSGRSAFELVDVFLHADRMYVVGEKKIYEFWVDGKKPILVEGNIWVEVTVDRNSNVIDGVEIAYVGY